MQRRTFLTSSLAAATLSAVRRAPKGRTLPAVRLGEAAYFTNCGATSFRAARRRSSATTSFKTP